MGEDEYEPRIVIIVCDGPIGSILQDIARERAMAELLRDRGSDMIIAVSNYGSFRDDDLLPLMVGCDTIDSKRPFLSPDEAAPAVSRTERLCHSPLRHQYHPPVRRLRTGNRGK